MAIEKINNKWNTIVMDEEHSRTVKINVVDIQSPDRALDRKTTWVSPEQYDDLEITDEFTVSDL
jgi:hypothetical protein